MSESNSTESTLQSALEDGRLLPEVGPRFLTWYRSEALPAWAREALEELVATGQWEELNDRFYQDLAFGTGGMRGRTIGRVSASSEVGPDGQADPRHAAVGAHCLNDFNVARATLGLYRHTRHFLEEAGRGHEVPSLVLVHDVRFFSRRFAELAASVWSAQGGQAYLYDGPRSTPQLSFSVRFLGAHAGVVITASHNPPAYNGFKAYFEDGAQTVSPHAEGIMEQANAATLAEIGPLLTTDLSRVRWLGSSVDEAYRSTLLGGMADPGLFRRSAPRVVYSPIHGTGAVAALPLLEAAGLSLSTVEEQLAQDPLFSTVDSPNPENAEALTLALAQADREGAEVVLATDPDGDRMGAAVRNARGEMVLLTGNMIGSLLAEFRIREYKKQGLLPAGGSPRAALVKTFVTTPLQESIAERHGLKAINTLTGFKWIGAKLRRYEEELQANLRASTGMVLDYAASTLAARARLLLEHSTFYVFGGEESYGYLATDLVRDKDANAAILLFCEMAARLREEGRSVLDFLEEIYRTYGYYREDLGNVYYEGASGAEKIANILRSYREDPPTEIGGYAVEEVTDFGRDTVVDADGETIPAENFFFLRLAEDFRFAVRGSGTEPKIKFYVFGRSELGPDGDYEQVAADLQARLRALREAIEADAAVRAG